MSLILDALKKSEAERQRQVGPTLLEVHVPKPRRRYPIWALAVGILLALNVVLLLVFVLRRSGNRAAEPPLAAARAPLRSPAPPTATMAAASSALPATGTSAPAITQPTAVVPTAPFAAPDRAPTLAQDSLEATSNPADEKPAVAPSSPTGKAPRDTGTGYSSLPSFSEVGGNLPDLRLDLHVYADRPRDRYALINMQTVHEGDTLSEGARVIAITRDGVALDYRGQQFMLRPQ
jgi:general secretion pathway protein B